jgi:DNA-binding beta-propeller fold protein YncE
MKNVMRFGVPLAATLVIAACGGTDNGSPTVVGAVPTNDVQAKNEDTRSMNFQASLGQASQPALALLAGNMDGPGNVDGVGSAARFDALGSIFRRNDGKFLVVDKNNKAIRVLERTGVVTTLFRNPSGASAEPFALPEGVVHDSTVTGRTYVTDRQKQVIYSIEPDGQVRVFAGKEWTTGFTDSLAGQEARFSMPLAMTMGPSGQFFVVDRDNNAIRKVDPSGAVSTLTGQPQDGPAVDDVPASEARFNQPVGIAFAKPLKYMAPAGKPDYRVYISDTRNHVIRYYSAHDGRVRILAGKNGAVGSVDGIGSAARFERPEGLAVNSAGDYLAVADTGNNIVRRIYIGPGERFGAVETVAGAPGQTGDADGPASQARFQQPSSVAFDATGDLLVNDFASSTVRKVSFSPTPTVSTLAGAAAQSGFADGVGAAARFSKPAGLLLDGQRALVADSGNHLVRAVAADGSVTRLAGQAGQTGANDGPALQARFNQPTGLAQTAVGGVVYVADTGNATLRAIDLATNLVSTVAGLAGQPGSADGGPQTSRFGKPAGVAAVVGQPHVYITDIQNHTVRWYDETSGQLSTIAGLGAAALPTPGFVDGLGNAARFNQPAGIVSASPGMLYVLDAGNRAIRKLTKLPDGAWSVSTVVVGLNLTSASAIAVDEAGDIYVSDTQAVIRRFSPSGANLGVVVGTADMVGFVPGAAPGVINNAKGMALRNGRLVFTGAQGVGEVSNLTAQ